MMDIVQEHIDLLRRRLEVIRGMVGPVRRYKAGRNCQKGYNCGGSCITRRKNCRKALSGEAKNFSEWMVAKMSAEIGGVLGDAPKDVKRTADGKPTSDTSAYDVQGFNPRTDKVIRKEDGGTYAVSKSGAFPDTLVEFDGVDDRMRQGIGGMSDARLKEAKRENAKDPYMSKEGAAERAAFIDAELKRRDEQRQAAKEANQKVLDDMEAKARRQREEQGLAKSKAEPKPKTKNEPKSEEKPQSRKDIEKTGIRMSTGETVKGERLGKALDQVANDIEQKARKARNDPGNYPPNVSDRIKDQYLESDLQRAQKIRNGEITNVSDLMLVNSAVTGKDAPILPKAEPKQKTEPKAKAEPKPKSEPKPKAEPKANTKPKTQKDFDKGVQDRLKSGPVDVLSLQDEMGLDDKQFAKFVNDGIAAGKFNANRKGDSGFDPRKAAQSTFGKDFAQLTPDQKQQLFKQRNDKQKADAERRRRLADAGLPPDKQLIVKG